MADLNSPAGSGTKWLWIALLVLLAAALLFWLFNPAGEPSDNIVTDEVAVDTPDIPAVSTSEPITNPAFLPSIGADIGRTIAMDSVPVVRVIGDAAFTVGEGGNETLVMFDETASPARPMEGMEDINPGSSVVLRGTVRSLEGVTLPEGVAEEFGNEPAYIAASEVEAN